jgi:DNA-binding NtrC family response regulator
MPKEPQKEVIVLDPDQDSCEELCALLKGTNYRSRPSHTLQDLEIVLNEGTCLVAILDLNMPSLDNRVVRELTLKNPNVYFLGLTRHRFNPELEESICYHVYACLTKPVDREELLYWLKSIYEDEAVQGDKH